jgi:hypothetical protein
MEKTMKEFIALHNRTVSRDEVQTVIALAKEQNNTEVIYRLSKILNDHPDSKRFNINIINYPQETDNQARLAGAQHSGDYREALDDCGRLKKGWHFVDGKVVKVQKRSGLLSQYTEKEFGHPFPKSLKEKFKELNWKYDRKNKRYYTPVPENEAEKEQQAQMFAFIEQEKSRIEANGNFPSAPSSVKSAPSDKSAPSSPKKTSSKRLEILENSLKKKKDKFNERFNDYLSDVKRANGQPLNDKRNGINTLNRWSKKEDSLRTIEKDIEKTKQAIEQEQKKIDNVNFVNEYIPQPIKDLVEKGILNQWRKYPNRFFVEGVEKARIIFDKEKGTVLNQYYKSIPTKEQKEKFAKVFNELKDSLNAIPLEERTAQAQEEKRRQKEANLNYLNKEIAETLARIERFESKSQENKAFAKEIKSLSNEELKQAEKKAVWNSDEFYYITDISYYNRLLKQRESEENNISLAGAQHSGYYREALDDCGRLKKGWHFVDGKAVKVATKKMSQKSKKSASSDTESYFLQREEQVKRAELIRKARKEGHTEEEIRQRAKKLGYDNIDLLINLSYLNPKGEISRAYIYYPDNKTPTITKMVNWAGEARRKYPFLEDEHEQQFFDLYDQQFYEKKDKKYLFEKIEELASKYHSFEELMKKHNIKGNVFFFDKLIAAVKVSLRKSNYKEVPDWYIRYSVPIDTDKPLTKENKDFLKKYFAAEVSKVVKPFALKEKYTTWVEFKQKGLELLSKIITPSDKSEKSDSSPKFPALGSLFGKYHEINTLAFKMMKVTELRAFTLEFYRLFLKGKKKEIEKHLKEVVFTSEGGRKIAYGEAMYSAKAAVIEHLGSLIKNSTYNNWGDRKPSDSEEILGYLNFKSKITIDGKKRHVRIAISVDKDRNLKFKSYDVGKKKSASTHKGVKPFNGGVETLSNESIAKTVPNSALSAPEVFVEHSSDPSDQSVPSITPRNNSLANKMIALQNHTFETFIIANQQMQAFLGDVERKTTGSTAITLTGGAGSGKTRFAFQFINALAQNYKVGHASLEEQPDSKLYFDKVHQYLDETAQANVEAPDIENMQDVYALIERNDVIVIDSFTKIREWDRNFLLDRDLRKKYHGKLFLIIFQQTVAGNMRGGTTSEFDGDIILYTQVFPDYRENYIYPSKNRYNSTPREQLRYSVYYQQLLPDESSPSESSPATSNTYEVIY